MHQQSLSHNRRGTSAWDNNGTGCWPVAMVCLMLFVLLGACSGPSFDKGKVAQVINQGLSTAPVCYPVPVGVPLESSTDKSLADSSLALRELLAQGLAKPGQISYQGFSHPGVADGYVFAESAA